MTSEEISDARKKRTKSFALDDNLIDKLEKLSGEGYFGSQSNIVSIALNDFFTKHAELLQKDMDMDRLLREYLNSPEGEAVVKEAISNTSIQKDLVIDQLKREISTLTKRNGVAEDWSGIQDMIRSMIEDVLKGKD